MYESFCPIINYYFISQLKNYCSQTSCTPEETLALDVDKDFKPLIAVHPKLVKRMKPHQKEGVKFMWKICYESINQLKIDAGSGCVIAHCMGLGKTFQVNNMKCL